MQYIPFNELELAFQHILFNNGFSKERADTCGSIFAQNSLEGVYSHGVNRFPYFVKMVKLGYIKIIEPTLEDVFLSLTGRKLRD